MSPRWFNLLVIAFWCTTMCWLVLEKVIPPLVLGEPPTYRTILDAQRDQQQRGPVTWQIYCEDRVVGWAQTEHKRNEDDATQIISTVELDELPLGALSPLRLLNLGMNEISLRAENTVDVDPLGRLVAFDTALWFGPSEQKMTLKGTMDGNRLKMSMTVGDFTYRTSLFIESDTMIANSLAPETLLPGLRLGQTWTVPVYSPLKSEDRPMDILQASVEHEEYVTVSGVPVRTMVVFIRADEGAGLKTSREARGKMWVAPDGTVVQQEARVMGTTLRFVRDSSSGASAPAQRGGADSTR